MDSSHELTPLLIVSRGVAIICDSRDPMVSGEGIALGLLLMMIGARMPKQLAEVAVVCVHRRETLAPIERMYNELINMKAHRELSRFLSFVQSVHRSIAFPDVEFLHFGDGVPVEPILVSGECLLQSFEYEMRLTLVRVLARLPHCAGIERSSARYGCRIILSVISSTKRAKLYRYGSSRVNRSRS